jgi:hypothetical protein
MKRKIMNSYDYTYYTNMGTLYNTMNNYNRPDRKTVFKSYYMSPDNRIISQKGGTEMINANLVQDYAETVYKVNSNRIDNLERKVRKMDKTTNTINYNFNGNGNITINNYGKN